MGRGKIEIKRIENSSNRQVTYSKRRNGLIKKAKEITVLCDAEVSLLIIGSSGKIHEYCSPSTNLPDILVKYHKQSGKRLWDAKHENLSNEIDRIKKENDNMQIELRHLRGEDITSLHYKELMALEDALENGLGGVREKQMEIYKMMKKNDRILEEEHKELNFVLHQREMEQNGYQHHHQQHQQLQDFEPQMPFTFRVQPMHPNLQERM
ncbi:agamous-like MADS-box protein MADS9 [Impatiens glandulifera]|nr:agamous-like MADS-box protein MADS9 [Impatiens glandulifera]